MPLRCSDRNGPAISLEGRVPEESEMEDRLGIQRVYPADTARSPAIRISSSTEPPRSRRSERVVLPSDKPIPKGRTTSW